MHWNLVQVMAVLAAVGMLAMAYRFFNTPGWEWLGFYSLITFVVLGVNGLFAAKKVGKEIMGLDERIVVTKKVK